MMKKWEDLEIQLKKLRNRKNKWGMKSDNNKNAKEKVESKK